MTAQPHRIPVDRDAETWVVGSILLKPALLDDLGWLKADDFFHDDTRKLYGAMVDMHRRGEPVDYALVAKRLGTDAWAGPIAEISAGVPTPSHALKYATIVAENAKKRRILGILEQGAADITDTEPDELLERVESDLAGIRASGERGDPVSIAEAAVEASVRVDAIAARGTGAGLPTGLIEFDSKIGGLFPGELTILAARPGVGKTSLGLQIAAYNAVRNRRVYLVSLEMSASELSTRWACGDSGVSSHLLRSGRLGDGDTARLADAFREQSDATMEIHDRASLTVAGIRREIRKAKKRGLALAMVDYLQLLTPADRRLPREQQVAAMVRSLKETAREYDTPILVLCQLNRQVDADDVPRLGQLRESGAIEQDADVVLFLSRHNPTNGERHNTVLSIAKNRNGDTGTLNLFWEPSRTRFSDHSYAEFAEL